MQMKPITDRKIRIAIVGCGRISKNHFASIKEHSDNLVLVAICEIDPDVRKRHEEQYQVKGYSELGNMLEAEDIDLIAICTPSGTHCEQVVTAAGRGVNIMTEKPMATRWQDGLRMVKACDDAGVYLLVVKQNRHNTTLQLLRRVIDEKRCRRI